MNEAIIATYAGNGQFIFENPIALTKGQRVIISSVEKKSDNFRNKEKFFALAGNVQINENEINELRNRSIL